MQLLSFKILIILPNCPIETEKDLDQWIKNAEELGEVAIDTETTSLDPHLADLVGISLSTDIGKACYIPIAHIKGNNLKKSNLTDLIDIVLEDLEKSKFINDKFYASSKAKSLINRGSSINKIKSYLMIKGVGEKYIKNTIEQIKDKNEDQDFFSAIKICKKKQATNL